MTHNSQFPTLDPRPATLNILTVTQLNQSIKETLEFAFSEVWVEGEISNCRTYPSGHTYFTLKDADSQVGAVLFKGMSSFALRKPNFELENGLQVLVRARLSTYLKRGEVQLVVSALEPMAKGALQLAFDQLKQKLEKEGLFDPSRKKTIPQLPQKIGIVTSLAGAAIRDILSVLERRFSNLEIMIYPVRVQGEGAKEEIACAISDLNKFFPHLEVLLVGRGGGSLEDLWTFNEEIVARAIAISKIPIISCVGHETDFTIADFVADLRAPTPSAAAELVVKHKEEISRHLEHLTSRLLKTLEFQQDRLVVRVKNLLKSYVFLQPQRLLQNATLELDDLSQNLFQNIRQKISETESRLNNLLGKLHALSPLACLCRGYSIVFKLPEHVVLKEAAQAEPGNDLEIRLYQGTLNAKVVNA